jgi:lipopolysaccharide transport system permease protein
MSVAEYVLYVCSGLVAFITFGAALPAGASSLASNRHVLLNTVFPAELIPVRSVLVASATLPAGLIVLLVADIVLGHAGWTWLLTPLVALLQTMFVIGIAWILALAVLLVRDIQQIIGYVVMLLLVVTPIAYTPDMVPSQLRWLTVLNPLAYYVSSYQYLIVLDRTPPISIMLGMLLLSASSIAAGFAITRAARNSFYDLA